MRFIYIPCEQYASRWTEFVSGPDGVVETLLKRYKIDYIAIRPELGKAETMATGVVLDTVFRTQWAMNQIVELVRMFFAGAIEKDDILYFEDFWTPGFEMIPYAADMTGIHPKIYSFCHAQSVDPHDFTAKMAPWMRNFEQAWAKCNTKIFTAAPELLKMLDEARVFSIAGNVAVGTIFDRSTLLRYAMMEDSYDPKKEKREHRVLFTSRWDKEKNPDFFLKLAAEVMAEDKDVEFAICTGHKELKSNDKPSLTDALEFECTDSRFKIYKDLSKADYYRLLRTSKVQFNCADQDFVSYTLLEAAVFGCIPLYPYYLTFPDAMQQQHDCLYRKGDLFSAKQKLLSLLSGRSVYFYSENVYGKYQDSFARMLGEMGYDMFSGERKLVDCFKR